QQPDLADATLDAIGRGSRRIVELRQVAAEFDQIAVAIFPIVQEVEILLYGFDRIHHVLHIGHAGPRAKGEGYSSVAGDDDIPPLAILPIVRHRSGWRLHNSMSPAASPPASCRRRKAWSAAMTPSSPGSMTST